MSIYLQAELDAALRADSRVVRFRYEALDTSLEPRGYLSGVHDGGSISYNYLAEVKRTGSITVDTLPSEDLLDGWIGADDIDYQADRLKIWFHLLMPDGGWAEWSLGVFIMDAGEREYIDGRVRRSIELMDLLWMLKVRTTTGRQSFAAGVNVVDTLTTQYLPQFNVPLDIGDSTETLTGKMEWDVNTTIMVVVNDMLGSIGYGSLYADVDGTWKSQEYTIPELRDIENTYLQDKFSVTSNNMVDEFELATIPNYFAAIVSQPDRPLLRSVFRNDDPNSPTSIPNRGGVIITLVQNDSEATTQKVLDQRVLALAAQYSTAVNNIKFTTALMPDHGEAAAIWLEHEGLGIKGLYIEHEFSMELKPGGKMTHSARRMVTVTGV